MPRLLRGDIRCRTLVDVKRVPELTALELADGCLRVGGAVTHRRLERDPLVRDVLPLAAAVTGGIANVRVRNAGTFAGSLRSTFRVSELALLVTLLDGRVQANGPLVEHVDLPLPDGPVAWGYRRFPAHGAPEAAAGAWLVLDDVGERVARARVALVCAGSEPARLDELERELVAAGRDARPYDAARPAGPAVRRAVAAALEQVGRGA